VTADEALKMIEDGQIYDAKTLTCVFWWLRERALQGKA
jgi:ADP-ribose pyrophosphatase